MLINGKPGQNLPVNDRGLLYGDGVFETIRVIDSQLSLWPFHEKRLVNSCNRLAIPVDINLLLEELTVLLRSSPQVGIVKIILTRGTGGRGYRPEADGEPTRIVQFHPLPSSFDKNRKEGVRVKFCEQPVSINSRLGGMKHLGRLDQVLASIELTDDYDEGLMSTDSGFVIEGTKSNLFAVINQRPVTPNLQLAGVAGVMRDYLLDQFESSGTPMNLADITADDLVDASELFLCNSVFGVWPVTDLVYQDQHYKKTIGPLTCQALEFQDNEFCSSK